MDWFGKLFPKVSSFSISPSVLEGMQSLALQTHPKEAFAVLSGKPVGSELKVSELVFQPFLNTTRSTHFTIDKYAITDFAGTFHSHPVPDATPSRADKRLFFEHPGVHCIMPFPYKELFVYNKNGELLERKIVHKV